MKKIEQLRRVRAAYSLLLNGMDLASAAYEAGFADQAHMTREFTRLAGSSPTRILAASAPPFASRP
ncbi:MAG: helix-turn-helix domain-containing protein [Proteobacteria bacterium]|nr:helix-turn-helix domain-containing protein [Pseudomonadota bacterium]